jgi:hypothetical protein
MCLPDGAHAVTQEFIYFHLPPSPLNSKTMFGLACFRQIDSKDLLHMTSDVTRTKVQKSVVILSCHPILPSLRSKLGLVTMAYFEQRDFSKVDILIVSTFYSDIV